MRRCGCVKTVLQRRKSVGFFFFFFIVFSLLLTYDGEIYLLTYLHLDGRNVELFLLNTC